LPILILGFVIAGVIGYLSIRWLLNYVKKNSFYGFAVYCVVISAVTLIVSALR
jgi:undecaprenyl-diphosphatase